MLPSVDVSGKLFKGACFIALGMVLLICAGSNLLIGSRPVAAQNDRIANAVNQSTAMEFSQRVQKSVELREQQESLLHQNPFEPYAWIRLAYLRQITQGNRRYAFEALRFADMISYPDNVGGIERILMWHGYADVQTQAERDREAQMWRTGFQENWYHLNEAAQHNHLWEVLKDAVRQDPFLTQEWIRRHKTAP